jgi:hypothetical protein
LRMGLLRAASLPAARGLARKPALPGVHHHGYMSPSQLPQPISRSVMFFRRRTAEPTDFPTAWRQNGAAKIDAFLSPVELVQLRSAVDTCYALLAQHADDKSPILSEYLTDHLERRDRIWIKGLNGYLKIVRPDILVQLDEVIGAADKRFRSLFEGNWWFDPNFSFVRRHRSTRNYLKWHIDADAANTISSTNYCINTWLPLDPVGDTAPSLEIIPGSNEVMRTVPVLKGPEKMRSDAWVKDNIHAKSWTPHAVPGDAILFDHWTLHRTQRLSKENLLRTSCEFRFLTDARDTSVRPRRVAALLT